MSTPRHSRSAQDSAATWRAPRTLGTVAGTILASVILAGVRPAVALVAFSPQQIISASVEGASRVVTADLDGDGDLDLVSASSDDDTFSWHRNDAGTFTELVLSDTTEPCVTPTCATVGARDVAVGDLDGDGDLDVVGAATGVQEVLWYRNDGSGEFAELPLGDLVALAGWGSVDVGDLNRDGLLDVVAGDDGFDAVVLFLNLLGSFVGTVIEPDADDVRAVRIADVDGDGDLDVLVAAEGDDTVAWVRNSYPSLEVIALPFVVDGARDVTGADVDRDGDLDLLAAAAMDDEVVLFRNDGAEGFTRVVVAPGVNGAAAVVAADLDRDGDVDFVAAGEFGGTLSWYENDGVAGAETFALRPLATELGLPRSLAVADLDRDGDPDVLAAGGGDHTLGWFENLTPPRSAYFPSETVIDPASAGPSGIDAGDIDRDGDVDLVVGSVSDDRIAWYRNDGAGVFVELEVAAGAAHLVDGVNSVELFDLDRDGDLDVLSAAAVGDDVAWHRNPGGSGPTPPVFQHFLIDGNADGVRHATAGDLDRDGRLDVVAAVGGEQAVFAYFTGGDASFSAGTAIVSGVGTVRSVAVGDIDADGAADVAYAGASASGLGWLESDGAMPPAEPGFSPRTLGGNTFWVALGDFDGLGRTDLVATAFVSDSLAAAANGGGEPPAFGLLFGYEEEPRLAGVTDLEIADLDADGRLDFLATSRDADRVVWLDNPGGALPQVPLRPLPPVLNGPLSLVTADLDGDGDLDIAVANELAGTVTILYAERPIFWDDFEGVDVFSTWSDVVPE